MGEFNYLYFNMYFVNSDTEDQYTLDDNIVNIVRDSVEIFNSSKDDEEYMSPGVNTECTVTMSPGVNTECTVTMSPCVNTECTVTMSPCVPSDIKNPVDNTTNERSHTPVMNKPWKSYYDFTEAFYAKRIWFNPPYTTVEWFNGEKTTACAEDPEKFSEYNGFAACVAKRLYGSTKKAIDVMNFGDEQAQLPKKLKAKRREEEKEEKRKIHEELMKHRKWELENAIHKERLARRAKEIVDGEEAEESGS